MHKEETASETVAPNLTISSPQKLYLWFHTFSFQEQASDNIL
jgi:hypothetical protein